ncbi:MAG: tetratricopeptide repeat protein [Anaerolineae bacterium]|nr:tetratricopeptide repeat protein [Anaerolineae bacterium]
MTHMLPDFDALWNYDDPAATERRFRDLLPAAQSSGDSAYLAQLMTQIARSEGLQRRFDAAHRTLDQVEALLPADPTTATVRCLLERGRVFNTSGRPADARPLFLSALEAAQEIGEDGFAVDAAHMMGIIEPAEEALAWNLRALALAESSPQPRARRWLGSLYNNIGWLYHDMEDFEHALDVFQKALARREQDGDPNPIRIAKWCVGRTLRSMSRVDEALEVQRALQVEHEAAGTGDGYVDEELGECLLAQGNLAAAQPHFARAYAALSQDTWLASHDSARLDRLRQLGSA